MAVMLSALLAGRPLPPGSFLVLISVRDLVNGRGIVRLERLGQLKNQMNSSGFEPETFRLVASCLKQLRYRVSRIQHNKFSDYNVRIYNICHVYNCYRDLYALG
jgi:hypothetical protein